MPALRLSATLVARKRGPPGLPVHVRGDPMNASPVSTSTPNIAPIVLGIAAALLIAAVLSGRQWPLIGDQRAALGLLLVLGLATCAGGGSGPAFAEGRWMAPLALMCIAIGAA